MGYSGFFWDALRYFEMHWNALGCFGMLWDALGLVGIFSTYFAYWKDVSGFFGMLQSTNLQSMKQSTPIGN